MEYHLSPLQVECTMFFQENPYAYETVQGLEIRLGRKAEDLSVVLSQLVDSMILEIIGTGESAIYRYVQPVSVGLGKAEPWKEI
ncbi:hypothetical protein AWH56_003110 [Anaerobacillus isosaccharinicus]|uniref:Uncharacterized protein n=1 Tax=Anaerobacillus isosaccharinicus TaxID=1532552 RepID=A0A1S2LXC5_9BACI|nr:hypothetical protein [Anaerobacillus isosaccharinicus]MBA5584967.1 hypothetical protein [Anaerobacillus isosaccharinicus]QOY36678.1 hypothetical protein AWH56_003110 [Anaerobacillus isosaccharinicus]